MSTEQFDRWSWIVVFCLAAAAAVLGAVAAMGAAFG